MNQAQADRDRVKRLLALKGLGTFDPAQAFTLPDHPDVDDSIFRLNYTALGECNGMLALLPDGVATIGVPMEIERAISALGVPVAIVGSATRGSWHLAGSTARHRVGLFAWGEESQAVDWLAGELVVQPVPEEYLEPLLRKDEDRVLEVKSTGEGGGLVGERTYDGDAGWDLVAAHDAYIGPHGFNDVACRVRVALPEGVWGLILGRSSTLRKRRLLVATAVIDQGYRGELFVLVQNTTPGSVMVKAGERLAQLIPLPLLTPEIKVRLLTDLEDLPESDRGDKGFGSTGGWT